VAARSAALHRTAYLLAGDWAHAEDLVQTALAKACLAWPRIAAGAHEAYTRKVLANTATSWWRRRWHGERPTDRVPDRTGEVDPGQRRVEQDEMWQRIRALPPRQRAVLVLRYYEDLTTTETAQLLGVSVGTVKSQSAKALATLRTQLEFEVAATAPTSGGGRR
jgi:RNA polymerase sigma-70 factor (sigma-E family)